MAPALLYCADMLQPRLPDDHFAAEARLAKDLAAAVALIDHDALIRGEIERTIARVPRGLGRAWYRGWMVGADQYADLARRLSDR